MPESLKDSTAQPSLTKEPDVVVPGLTAIKPSKVMKQFRPEKKSLAKLNMEEADVGEIDTNPNEEKTAGAVSMIDVTAYLAGYCYKQAGDKVTGRKVPGTKFRLGQKADLGDIRKAMNAFRKTKGKKPAAPDVQWAGKKGPSAGSRKQQTEAEILKD